MYTFEKVNPSNNIISVQAILESKKRLLEFQIDRCAAAFDAVIAPLAAYLAKTACAQFGGEWEYEFKVEECALNRDNVFWAYGYLTLSIVGYKDSFMLSIGTSGSHPEVVSIEDGDELAITDVHVDKKIDEIVLALLPSIGAWAEMVTSRYQDCTSA